MMKIAKIGAFALWIVIVFAFPASDRAAAQTFIAATLYSQPPDAAGGLYQSSWWAPDESNYDQFLYDNFTLTYTQSITEIQWRGGFDPNVISGAAAVADFEVAIFGSTVSGTEPNIVAGPLVTYQTGGNAGQSAAGTFGGVAMYDYSFTLPAAFQAQGGTTYWVYIVAEQDGVPDWGLSKGSNGDGQHFRVNHDGSVLGFRTGDLAFTLLGPPDMVCGISSNTPYNLADLSFTITDKGSNLDCVQVTKVPVDHPEATTGIQTGQYWDMNGLQIGGSAEANPDFVFNLTLPHSVNPHTDAKVCKFPGGMGGAGWDCERSGSDSSTVWRNGISGGFSDWAVGDGVTVTALNLVSFSAGRDHTMAALGTILFGAFSGLLILIRLWMKQRTA